MATRASRRLAEALSRAEHRVSRRISVALQAEGMSLEQWRVLSLLSDGAGHTMSDIARHVLLPAATLTRVIDRLVEVTWSTAGGTSVTAGAAGVCFASRPVPAPQARQHRRPRGGGAYGRDPR